MGIFSVLWKNIKKSIFVDEFDEKYENEVTATTFGLYCCLGGFCFHDDVRPRFRKFWIYFNVINFIFASVSCIFYSINVPVDDFISWLQPIQIMCGFLALVTVYYWVYSSRDLLWKVIDTIVETEKKYEKYLSFCTMRLKESEMKIVKISCTFWLFCLLAYNLENYVKYKNYIINFYPVYFPFRTNFSVRFIIRFVQMVTLLPVFLAAVSFSTLIFIITLNIYNRFELLSVFLRDASYSTCLSIDEITNLEIAMDEQRIPSTSAKIRQLAMRKELTLNELVRKTIVVMERYRELYFTAKSLAEKLEHICYLLSATALGVVVVDLVFTSSIIDSTHPQLSLLFTLSIIGIFVYWLIFCIVGELFQNMNGIVAMELYESPWYHLKPKDRRLFHSFMNMIQKPISIVIWRIHTVNMGAFPDMLAMVYSNMQRVRTIQSYKSEFCT